jgi:hypothetical protein
VSLELRNATWAALVIALGLIALSFRWVFLYEDLSTFLTFFVIGCSFLVHAYLLQRDEFKHLKLRSLDGRLDSLVLQNNEVKKWV